MPFEDPRQDDAHDRDERRREMAADLERRTGEVSYADRLVAQAAANRAVREQANAARQAAIVNTFLSHFPQRP